MSENIQSKERFWLKKEIKAPPYQIYPLLHPCKNPTNYNIIIIFVPNEDVFLE